MNNKTIIKAVLLVVVIFGVYMIFSQSKTNNDVTIDNVNINQEDIAVLKTISSNDLEASFSNKDFKLVDVHIPEQKHIPQTDYFISYKNIDEIVATFPNKDEKIVLYCRSGGMSRIVAEELVKRGYTNIFDLEGGVNKWISEGKEVTAEINNNT